MCLLLANDFLSVCIVHCFVFVNILRNKGYNDFISHLPASNSPNLLMAIAA